MLRPVVDDSAGQRAELGMMLLDGRLDMWRRPEFAIEVERMAAFVAAPAVVLPFADEVGLLPQVLAVLPDPDVPRFDIHGGAPWIAKAVSPRLPADVLLAVKRIVLGDGVGLAFIRMVHVDPQQLG